MDQKEIKDLLTLKDFLASLEGIISNFKTYVQVLEKRLESLDERAKTIDKTIRDLNNQIVESNKNIERQINLLKLNNHSNEKTLPNLFDTVSKPPEPTKKKNRTTIKKEKPNK